MLTLLLSIVALYAIFLEKNEYISTMLFIFLLLESVFELKRKQFMTFLWFAGIQWGAVLLLNPTPLSFLLYAIMLMFSFHCNESVQQLEEKDELYKGLLGEYRLLKRKSFANEQLVRIEERAKVTRDIHDTVGHKLTALLMQIQMLILQQPTKELMNLKQLAEESLEETRNAVRTLSNQEIIGLESVLQLIKKLESESHIQVDFNMGSGVLSQRFSNEINVTVYRVIQEAITNALRHGFTQKVEVSLKKTATNDLSIKVTNKLHNQKPLVKGFGLTNMDKRVKELGGRLYVSQENEQFYLNAIIPVGGE
ncbi:histidine kinase [Bacillus carboniphilus]|uniref:histidine kinase n=1 Tax=Bacillus carboniphilus TaxID=86663 RepID=A0ABY9JWX5_9BACI|nr:histidine kinase [Bacillus carboniphilus]WLR43283.1 histidine kinase [Bacillus carboniphilus]